MSVDLSQTSPRGYHPGRSYAYRALWLVVEALILLNPIVTQYSLKCWVLRRFGARIGRGVLIKPNVHVKYPWHLEIGDNTWIGERVWIDNFVRVRIGANAVVSQGAYLCTGNHDWSDPGMGLVVKPVLVEDGAWVGAFARIAPGITVGREVVVTLGSVLLEDAEARGVYTGNPAVRVRDRAIRDRPGPKELVSAPASGA
ncbi:MAG: colanic acid biosynthesis acetyltransferase WcaF [Chloroflexi bacterium]|nr:colanic acid biosynthesis acetyltransferase WcaF [Chloroflexota bacterium]